MANPKEQTLQQRNAELENELAAKTIDLQQKTRELEIESALEKVRSSALAMKLPADMLEICRIISGQLELLQVNDIRNVQTAIFNEAKSIYLNYEYYRLHDKMLITEVDYTLRPEQVDFANKMLKSPEGFFTTHFEGAKVQEWVAYQSTTSQFIDPYLANASSLDYYFYSMGPVALGMSTYSPLDEENIILFKRFRNVFELAYRRYMDIEKAKAQARQAQIEVSLERVRTKAMAMQKSNDLAVVVATIFEELDQLHLETLRCCVGILNKEKCSADVWTTTQSENGNTVQVTGDEPMDIHPLLKQAFDAWVEQKEESAYTLEGEDLVNFYKAIKNTNFKLPDSQSIMSAPGTLKQYYYVALRPVGGLYAFRETTFPDEAKILMKRFADVFNLTYTRFLDLQKAEAQAREATIEAALEKVRGKAMAMQNSNDLSSTANMIFTELRKLGINPIRCGVGLLVKESRKAQLYSATSSTAGDSLALMGWVILSNHPVLEKIYESWINNEDYFPVLSGEQLGNYYELLLSGLSVPQLPDWQAGEKQYGHFIAVSVGCLYAWSATPYTDAEIKILKRFATIIDLTFRRYMELQQSEANAKETVRQASLDRVRAEIASMRTTDDLEKITPLIWNELTILAVPFIRCGVFIMDDEQQTMHSFLSTPDGKAIAAFHLSYNTPGNIAQVLNHWQNKKMYTAHWYESDFSEMAHTLLQQGSIGSEQEYLSAIPPGGFYLHFLPFLQGMLYVGNTTLLDEDAIQLIQSIADAFSTAYARYEDFNQLEIAKRQVEKTLTDLKQAQTQLVQAEKMASLGELTAGIAHEIQNPLNFVNNFSEVSNELLDEMKTELDKGDTAEALAIAKNLHQNLEKILHHGKRADSIVKGMLQHSRTSGGQKEPTDINALANEYLRLTYHGLRAKDKDFNATIKTDFDESIGKINIVPQDIGRMLLNIFSNAFYSVAKKKLQSPQGYEPTVSVSTKKFAGKIEIKIKDNGNGIPQKILDKIFQPFFTTKPTGQGTGLGLSLAYDIVKAHGGEIRVETKEGEGAEFVVELG